MNRKIIPFESPNGYYLYKYIHKETQEYIYIGLSTNLPYRINQHASGYGIEKKFLSYVKDCNIYYHKCSSREEMVYFEKLLIMYYKPVLNISHTTNPPLSINSNIEFGNLFKWNIYLEEKFLPQSYKMYKKRRINYNPNINEIEEYFVKHENDIYTFKQRKEIINLLQLRDSDSHIVKGITKLNSHLYYLDIGYTIKKINKRHKLWQIVAV